MKAKSSAGWAAVPVLAALYFASVRYQLLDERRWIALSAVWTAVAAAGFLCLPSFRRGLLTSEQRGLPPGTPVWAKHGLRVLGWLMLLVSLGAACAFATAALNGGLDSAPPTCRRAKVLSRGGGGGARGRSSQVAVESWRPGRESETILVSHRFGARVPPTGALDVCTRTGALGIEWVSSYNVAAETARCDGASQPVTVRFLRQGAEMRFEGAEYVLEQTLTGSGARYASAELSIWIKGDEARLERPGVPPARCVFEKP